jgi:hypothetical protein
MASRFGRNQKRRLHAEVARLEAERDAALVLLDYAQNGEWRRATEPGVKALTDFGVITTCKIIDEDPDPRGMIRRRAEITLYATDYGKALDYFSAYSGLVGFRGIAWKIATSNFYNRYEGGIRLGDDQIEIELEAIGGGPKNPYRFKDRYYPRHHAARTIVGSTYYEITDGARTNVQSERLWPDRLDRQYIRDLVGDPVSYHAFRDRYECRPSPLQREPH